RNQPVLITLEPGNANSAQVQFLIGHFGDDWAAVGTASLQRVVLLFDGRDEDAVRNARLAWKAALGTGHDVTYWKEDSAGKFSKQA
ncbi:MAG: DNA polymerase III subunit chi, partial [Alphaproteobacteria bacterium]|nr:DNA polymerase III subunit chi [Alphaproteobacteria bacterium]